MSCHATLGEKHKAIVTAFDRDIHKEKGLSCHSCHGGNPDKEDIGEAKDASFKGAPSKADMPRFCGSCHSDPGFMKKHAPSLPVDQEAKFFTSAHGAKVRAGDLKAASCADCHPAHSIRPAKDPTSSVYSKNIPQTCAKCHAGQLGKYLKSVHGKALLEKGDSAAPACNTCHGNHGAAPPGAADIGHVCGMCHAGNEASFNSSPMAKPWKKRALHMCATCHGHHDIQRPGVELLSAQTGLCRNCHRPDSSAMGAAASMKAGLEALASSYHSAESSIAQAEEKGMDMAEARGALDAARMALYQSKTAVHTFQPEKVAQAAGGGMAASAKARKSALDAILDFKHRRIGLGVATLLLAFLAAALYLKLRDLESGD